MLSAELAALVDERGSLLIEPLSAMSAHRVVRRCCAAAGIPTGADAVARNGAHLAEVALAREDYAAPD